MPRTSASKSTGLSKQSSGLPTVGGQHRKRSGRVKGAVGAARSAGTLELARGAFGQSPDGWLPSPVGVANADDVSVVLGAMARSRGVDRLPVPCALALPVPKRYPPVAVEAGCPNERPPCLFWVGSDVESLGKCHACPL